MATHIKDQSRGLLKRLRPKPVVAVVVANKDITFYKAQTVRKATIVGTSTRRPIGTELANIVQLTIPVVT